MMFRLKALGGLALQADSQALPSSAHQRRRLALLVRLAAAGTRGISRDRLLAYFWPESSAKDAQHALDQLLYATRRDLGKQAVISESGQLRLDPEIVRSDFVEFEERLERGEPEEAIALYAGPFLDGVHLGGSVELERWVETERARLEEGFVGALERMARSADARGDAQSAVLWWRRRSAAEPLSARGAVGVMQALAAAGDRAGALRYSQTYAVLLREELGVEPEAEVLELAERLTQEPDPRPKLRPSTAPSTHPVPADEGHPAEGPVEDFPAVGLHGLPRIKAPAGEVSSPRSHVPARWLVSRASRATLVGCLAMAAGLGGAIVLGSAHTPAVYTIGAASGEEFQKETGAQSTAIKPRATVSVRAPDAEAHALFLRARIEWNRRSREGLQRAVVLFRQATERDPMYAEAYAGLADAYVILGYLGYLPGDAAFPKGKAAALQALALDPTMGEAHAALGVALQWEKRWAEAEQAFVHATEYAPEYATGHQWYALLLTILGREHEAVRHGRRAAELDPLSIQIHNTYGIMLYNVGALDSALAVYERIVTNEPDTAWVRQNPWVLSNFGKVAAVAGRHAEGVRLVEQAAQAVPGHPRPLYELAVAYFAVGDPVRARAIFNRADPNHPHYPVYRGLLNARLGDLEGAFAWLDRVEEWGPVTLLTLCGSPDLDVLQADPRYFVLRRRVGLPASR